MSNELKHDLANATGYGLLIAYFLFPVGYGWGFSLIVFLLMFNAVLAVSALVRVIKAAWNC